MAGIETPKNSEGLEPGVYAHVMRHGETLYTQPEATPIEEAQDLTPEGEKSVRENAERIADLVHPDEEVAIWSSPMGRTLHTAKIVAQVLEERGIKLRRKGASAEYGIEVMNSLQEVQNFKWDLFVPLVTGGSLTIGEHTFEVDKAVTNPDNLEAPQYFFEDAIKNIPPEIKAKWPQEYVEAIEAFESSVEVTKRILRPFSLLKQVNDKPYRIIIVTHDGLTSFFVNAFTEGEQFGVNRGEFVNLDLRNGEMVISEVGGNAEGDFNRDILTRG